jgi:triacylglycerol esterase/lipase EstA (alpha/beta hydrolase family)
LRDWFRHAHADDSLKRLLHKPHSMGGLLVKEILLHAPEGQSNFRAATSGVVFLATPHTGSGVVRAVEEFYIAEPSLSTI